MRVVVVGAGRAGTAVAVLLRAAGHDLVAVAGREATRERAAEHLPGIPLMTAGQAVPLGELVLLGVPDDLLGPLVADLAAAGSFAEGQWVAHLSGAAGLGVLTPARAAGARRLAVHPLQTFPDVERALTALPGCTTAVTADDEEGYAVGERLARDLGATPFRLADDMRPLYHAAAVFASNSLVAISAAGERLFAEAGVPDPMAAMLPLQMATLSNVAALGPADALTGPAVRGDAGTVAANLEALGAHGPGLVPAYVVLCRLALDLAEGAGRLTAGRRAAVEEVLARWS